MLTVTPRDQLQPLRNRGGLALCRFSQDLPMLCRPPVSGAANTALRSDALCCLSLAPYAQLSNYDSRSVRCIHLARIELATFSV